MAYFYVKSSYGTRTTGGGTTKQTGAFSSLGASNVYANIPNAITDGAGADDIICVSDSHSETGTTITISGPTSATTNSLEILCVQDSNCDTVTVSSSANITSGNNEDIILNGRVFVYGIYFYTKDDIVYDETETQYFFHSCTLEADGSSDKVMYATAYGQYTRFINCTFKGSGQSETLQASHGMSYEVIDCNTDTLDDSVVFDLATTGGIIGKFYGCDFSSIDAYLVQNIGNAVDDDFYLIFQGCQISATLNSYAAEELNNPKQFLKITNSQSTAVAEYQYHFERTGGVVEDQDDSGIHRNETTAWPSGEKTSLKCTTDTKTTKTQPFFFDFPTKFAEFSKSASDTLRIYLAIVNTTTLTDNDVWIECCYPDGTNKHEYKFATSQNTNKLATGTTLTDDSSSSTWKNGASDLTGYNEYRIDLATTSGGDTLPPYVRVFVAETSATIYFDKTLDFV